MNITVQDAVQTSGEMSTTGQMEVLCPWKINNVRLADQASAGDSECAGFDPYDTASLYVKKS